MVSRFLIHLTRVLHLNTTRGFTASPTLQLHRQPLGMCRKLLSKIIFQKDQCEIDAIALLLNFLSLACRALIYCIQVKTFRVLLHIIEDYIQYLKFRVVLIILTEWMDEFSLYTCTPSHLEKKHTLLWINQLFQTFKIYIFFQKHPRDQPMEVDESEKEIDMEM